MPGIPLPYATRPLDPANPYLPSQARYRFENDYGASVIRGLYTYGGAEGLFELAVLHFTSAEDESELCYQTPVAGDVIGYLSESGVWELLGQIAALPPRADCPHVHLWGGASEAAT